MRRVVFLIPLLAACATDAPGIRIGCVDAIQECYHKAQKACPSGYEIIQQNPPSGMGIYYANHYAITAKESMGYSILARCH